MVKISFIITHTVVKDYCLVNNHEIVMIWVDLSLENSEVWYKCVESNTKSSISSYSAVCKVI